MSRALSDSISCPIPQNLIHALKKAPHVDTSKHFFLHSDQRTIHCENERSRPLATYT